MCSSGFSQGGCIGGVPISPILKISPTLWNFILIFTNLIKNILISKFVKKNIYPQTFKNIAPYILSFLSQNFYPRYFLVNIFDLRSCTRKIIIIDDKIDEIDYFLSLSFNFWLHLFHPLSPNLSRKCPYPQ